MDLEDLDILSQYRVDGRKPNELRDISFKLGISSEFDGSSYYKQGLTEIYCFVEGPVHVI